MLHRALDEHHQRSHRPSSILPGNACRMLTVQLDQDSNGSLHALATPSLMCCAAQSFVAHCTTAQILQTGARLQNHCRQVLASALAGKHAVTGTQALQAMW